MAEAWLKSLDSGLEVKSAGTFPGTGPNPYAVAVMDEIGLNIRGGRSDSVDLYLNERWDYVITVCDRAKAACPGFPRDAGEILHIGFEDPADASGSEAEILGVYRRVRDEIVQEFSAFFRERLSPDS